jgi:hypothetical protein
MNILLVDSSKNAERIRRHRARLTEEEKNMRKAKNAERMRCERKAETKEEKEKRQKNGNKNYKLNCNYIKF